MRPSFRLEIEVEMYRMFAVLALIAFVGCESKSTPPAPSNGETAAEVAEPSTPSKVDGAKAKTLVAAGAVLLDVRTKGEWDGGHIEGATHVPVQELDSRLADVGAKDKAVVVYCASGIRSARAATALAKAGWKEVYDLGGMSNW